MYKNLDHKKMYEQTYRYETALSIYTSMLNDTYEMPSLQYYPHKYGPCNLNLGLQILLH